MIRYGRVVRPVHREGELIMASDASFLSLVLSKALYQVKVIKPHGLMTSFSCYLIYLAGPIFTQCTYILSLGS